MAEITRISGKSPEKVSFFHSFSYQFLAFRNWVFVIRLCYEVSVEAFGVCVLGFRLISKEKSCPSYGFTEFRN